MFIVFRVRVSVRLVSVVDGRKNIFGAVTEVSINWFFIVIVNQSSIFFQGLFVNIRVRHCNSDLNWYLQLSPYQW